MMLMRVQMMAMRQMGVMRGLLMIARLMMLMGFTMMMRCSFMVMRGMVVVVVMIVFTHDVSYGTMPKLAAIYNTRCMRVPTKSYAVRPQMPNVITSIADL